MDVERIREALAMLHRFPHMRHGIELQPLAEVARLVVGSREANVCQEHWHVGIDKSCLMGHVTGSTHRCDMTKGRLLVPPKGEI